MRSWMRRRFGFTWDRPRFVFRCFSFTWPLPISSGDFAVLIGPADAGRDGREIRRPSFWVRRQRANRIHYATRCSPTRERKRTENSEEADNTPPIQHPHHATKKKETSKRRGRRCWWWRYGDVAAGDGSESADNEPSPSVKVLSSQSAQTTGRNCLHRGHWLVGCTAAILVSICTSLFFFFFSLFLSFSFFLSFPLFFPRPERAQIGRASTSPTGDEEEEEEEEEEETDKTGSERERERERERKRVSRQWLAANVSNILSSRLS